MLYEQSVWFTGTHICIRIIIGVAMYDREKGYKVIYSNNYCEKNGNNKYTKANKALKP